MYARFGPDAARSWSDARSSSRTRWVALGLGVVGIVASAVGTPEAACSPLGPCTDLDVDSFGVYLGLLALSFVGLWLWPTAGAVLGIGAALVDVLYDPSVPGRVVHAAYAAACVLVLVGLGRSRRRQREIVAEIPTETVVATHVPVVSSGREVWSHWLWVGAGAGVLVAVLSYGVFAQEKAADEMHRERAVKASGTVLTGWGDDLRQRVRVDQGGLPAEVWVSGSSELPRGTEVRFLIDPRDPTWTEMPDDPADHSGWLALGLIGAGGALGAGGLGLVRRRFASAHLREGIAVEVSVSASGTAHIRPLGGTAPIASFPTGRPAAGPGAGGARRRVDWVRAIAVGDLRDRGWVKVFTGSGLVTPAAPLRVDPSEPARPDVPGDVRGRTHRRRALVDRLPSRGNVLSVGVGLLLAGSSIWLIPDAIAVARGDGVPGTITITSESCSKSCSYSGDFRSTDGTYVFRDIPFEGSGEVGSTSPAVYVGAGEEPDQVYEAGNGLLLETGFFTLVGLAMAAWPFVGRLLDRHTPPGRHGPA